MENKQVAFLEYAKKKGWDASLCVFNGRYLAIMNPVNIQKIYEGESKESIEDAMEKCKKELLK